MLDIRSSQRTPSSFKNRSDDTLRLVMETQLSGNEEVSKSELKEKGGKVTD